MHIATDKPSSLPLLCIYFVANAIIVCLTQTGSLSFHNDLMFRFSYDAHFTDERAETLASQFATIKGSLVVGS